MVNIDDSYSHMAVKPNAFISVIEWPRIPALIPKASIRKIRIDGEPQPQLDDRRRSWSSVLFIRKGAIHMRFFTVSQEYLTYLKKRNMIKTDMCNVWGIPLRMGRFLYFLPFYASDCSDYDDQGNPRSSPPVLFRLIRYGKCEASLFSQRCFLLHLMI